MKMLYLQKNRARSNDGKRILWVIVIFILGSLFFSFTKGIFMRIASPAWQTESNSSNSFWKLTNYFKTKGDLISENQALKIQVTSLESQMSENLARQSAFEAFTTAYSENSTPKGIAAGVLVRPPETPYDMLIVGVGSQSGVHGGSTVTLPEGSKIGTVVESFKTTSKIKLYSSSGEKTSAILERNAVPIELIGQGGGNFLFNLPREMSVEIGDKVVDTSIEGSLLGVVGNIEVTSTDSFKKVIVKSVTPINRLRFILIQE